MEWGKRNVRNNKAGSEVSKPIPVTSQNCIHKSRTYAFDFTVLACDTYVNTCDMWRAGFQRGDTTRSR